MIAIEEIPDGFRVIETSSGWTWWVYPEAHEIQNNGDRYNETGVSCVPKLSLRPDWTLGDVVNSVIQERRRPPIDDGNQGAKK